MTIIDKMKDLLRMLAENIHKRRKVVLALSCVVVFVTTYMLILPAFTLEKSEAAEQGGIDVPGITATSEEVSEEDEMAEEAGEQTNAQDVQSESGKTEDGKVEDSGSKSKDSGEAKADSAQTADPLTFEDEHYTIAVDDKNSVLPENTEIKVEEIDKAKDEKEYQKHFDDALAAIQEEKDGENVSDLEFARFYDISLVSDGKEVTLGKGDKVNVNIEYDKELRKALGVENKDNIRIIHFAENKDTGKVEAEVLDNKEAKVEVNTDKKDQLKEASFEAESFSVYAVVYTVDFEYEDEATHEVYKYSMEGGSSITLKKLAVILGITTKDKADEFIANVEDVKFSDEKLVKVEKTDNGWTLKSLKAFDTTETLTITMKDGSVYEVKVTDEAQTDVDLRPFITDATLQIDGRTYGAGDTWKVRPDVDYKLTLTFNEKGSRQLPDGGSTMVMDLPSGLTLEPGAGGTFDIPCGLAGTLKGNRWWVTDDGKLHIQLAEDPDDLLNRSSNIHISLGLNAQFDGTTTEFEFNDKVKREVEYDNSASASITKSGHYNSSTNKMEYTLTVKSTGATRNVKVTDVISGDMLSLDENSITINPSSKTITSQNANSKGFDLTISEMSHNETVTINYTASVDLSKVGPGGTVTGENGKNSVTVKPENGPGDKAENIVNTIKYSSISKSSTSQKELAGDKVELTWQIVANKGSQGSLAGSKITDRIDWGSKDVMKYARPLSLEINAYNQDGTFAYTRTETVTVADNQGQESWTYTIPETDKNHNYYYEISYKTIADQQTDNNTVKNNVDNESDGSSSGSAIVPGTNPGGGGGTTPSIVTTKTAKKVTTEYVDWDIVINVPAEGFPNGLTVVDNIPYLHQYRDTYVDVLGITGLKDNEDYSVTTSQEHTSELEPVGKTRDVVTIEFYKNHEKTQKGLEAGARTVTITIRTRNDQDWIDYAETRGGGDPAYYHTNNAKVNDVDVSAQAIPLHSKLEKEETKNGAFVDNGLPVYEYAVTLSNVTEEPVVIEDTFNTSDLKYYGLGNPYNGWDKIAAASQKHELNGGVEGYVPNIETTDTGIKITADELPKKEDGSFYEYYRIYYRLQIKDEEALARIKSQAYSNGGTYLIGNTAEWNDTPGHCDVKYEVPGLKKEGYFADAAGESSNERIYTFLIDVNPEKFEMNGGQPMELSDSHSSNLSVDYTSIQVYKITDNTVKPDPKQYNLSNYESAKGEVTWDFSGNTGTFTVPDKTHYVIKYNALVIGSGEQSISNVADMKGFSSTKSDKRSFGSEQEAGGDIYQIKLLKHMLGQTSEGLEGTTFQLFRGTGEYVYDEEGNIIDTVKEPMKWGVGRKTAGKVGENITFTTNADGVVTIALNQTDDGNELEEGVHYYLKEIDSPPGYQIDSSVEYWEFTLTKDPDEVSYGTERDPETGWRQWIYFYYDDILKMSNTPAKEPLTVNVNKSWFNANGEPISEEDAIDLTAKVQLLRKTNNGEYVKVKADLDNSGKVISVTELADDDTSGQVTLNKANNWEYSWGELPRVLENGTKYAYKIEEVELPGYICAVDESENETTKTYSLKNYEIPEDRDTSLEVKKQWMDAEGNEITSGNEPFESIHFYIYQVASTTPFETIPKSGGNKYVIPQDSRLVNPKATDADDEYGLYRISKTGNWQTVFENLPEVETKDGKTLYYSYYVKEVAPDGYIASYIDSGNSRTIVNKPKVEYINIGLEKKWKAGDNTTPPTNASATFRIHQLKADLLDDGISSRKINIVYNGQILEKANIGDEIEIHYADASGEALVGNGSYHIGWVSGSGTAKYTIPGYFQGDTFTLSFANTGRVLSVKNTSTPTPTYGEFSETAWSKTVNLPSGQAWNTTIKDLVKVDADGNIYKYYITEEGSAPEAIQIDFTDKDGNDIKDNSVEAGNQTIAISEKGSKVIATNTYEKTSTNLSIVKVDQTTKEKLAGAKFQLYSLNSTGAYTVYPDGEKTTDANGNIEYTELSDGRYKIVETQAPTDYVRAEDVEMYFTVSGDTVTWTDAQGTEITESQRLISYNKADHKFTVGNEQGVELPMTGGIGTTIFYILGSILVIGGGIYFISRRRAMK